MDRNGVSIEMLTLLLCLHCVLDEVTFYGGFTTDDAAFSAPTL